MGAGLTSVLAALLALFVAGAAGASGDFHALVRRAARGQPQAVRLLVRLLLPVIHARVRRFLACRAGRRLGALDADDLAQEIWCKLLEGDARLLLAWDPERSRTPQGYVGLLSQRELFNRLQLENAQKRGGGERPVPLDDAAPQAAPDPDPEEGAASRELLADMSVHLAAVLPEKGLAVLRALYEEGHDPPEAAAALGVSLQVVYNWQHRIRAEARAFLAACES